MKNQRIPMTDAERIKNQPYDVDVIPPPSHPSKANKFVSWVVIAALVLAGVGLLRILTWSFQDANPLVVNNSPFPTRSIRTAAEPDGVIILDVDFCKNTKIIGEVRTSFVSSSREVFLPLAHEQFDQGCRRQEIPVIIPTDLPADDYTLKFTVRYNLNPLKQNIPVVFESQQFHVNPASQNLTDRHE